MNDPSTVAVLRWISSRHDLDLQLVGPFGGGRQEGAWRVRSVSGDDLVLKWTTDAGIARRRDEAAPAVGRLRDTGYPTPAWVASGVTDDGWAWSVQQLASGEPGTWATVPLAELVATVELQARLGRSGPETWSSFVEWAARADDGPRRHLAATEAGRALVAHVDEVLRRRDRPDLPGGDLVHGDLNTSNVLVDSGRLSAIIDIDAIGSGTRAVDHAWLLREAFTVDAGDADKELIRAAGVEVAGPGVFSTCVAATVLDIAVFETAASGGVVRPDLVDRLHALLDVVG